MVRGCGRPAAPHRWHDAVPVVHTSEETDGAFRSPDSQPALTEAAGRTTTVIRTGIQATEHDRRCSSRPNLTVSLPVVLPVDGRTVSLERDAVTADVGIVRGRFVRGMQVIDDPSSRRVIVVLLATPTLALALLRACADDRPRHELLCPVTRLVEGAGAVLGRSATSTIGGRC